MSWYLFIAVIAAGFGAGFINTLAGSGSLITLPLLIFLGLPATDANGTNRIGVLFQTLVSTESFRSSQVLDMRGGLILSVPAVIGALVGAQIAVNLNETVMRRTIGVLMLVMLVVILVRPNRWLAGKSGVLAEIPGAGQMFLLFLVGIYGGFIQAGVGIFLLASLVLGVGYDLVRANAVKTLIVLCFTIFALAVFIYNDQVRWLFGILLAIGNALGGWVAARVAVERGADFVRWLLIGVILISAAQLLGLFTFISQLF
ncbi:MAG: sulfite exporter TauE/SafE family protein [Anaerolineae bacterium]|nr:sulfite exporter TauE/SafE family protein [Anaerolineae bacterium]